MNPHKPQCMFSGEAALDRYKLGWYCMVAATCGQCQLVYWGYMSLWLNGNCDKYFIHMYKSTSEEQCWWFTTTIQLEHMGFTLTSPSISWLCRLFTACCVQLWPEVVPFQDVMHVAAWDAGTTKPHPFFFYILYHSLRHCCPLTQSDTQYKPFNPTRPLPLSSWITNR